MDAGDFYRDGLFCAFSYIFDLDKPKRSLLLYSSYGHHPYKGYEDWFYMDGDGQKFYVKFHGFISHRVPLGLSYPTLLLRMGHYSRVRGAEGVARGKLLRVAMYAPLDTLPTILGMDDVIDGVISIRLGA